MNKNDYKLKLINELELLRINFKTLRSLVKDCKNNTLDLQKDFEELLIADKNLLKRVEETLKTENPLTKQLNLIKLATDISDFNELIYEKCKLLDIFN